ncbi:MAG: hypothetical protein KDD62_12870, partial [Bdellovibrionales bacterium]|nr:hypothetical protein [Bdellovibrionales bacterium]
SIRFPLTKGVDMGFLSWLRIFSLAPSDRFGMRMVAQAGDLADPTKLPISSKEIKLLEGRGDGCVASCGHPSYRELIFNVYGEELTLPGTKFCESCGLLELSKDIIPCIQCGLPIFPGDRVALYQKRFWQARRRKKAVQVDGMMVGCMRRDCCPCFGAYFAGHWGGERGFIPSDASA